MELWQVLGIAMVASVVTILLLILSWVFRDLLVWHIINKRYKKWCFRCLKEKIAREQKKIAEERLLNVLIEFAAEQAEKYRTNAGRDDCKERICKD